MRTKKLTLLLGASLLAMPVTGCSHFGSFLPPKLEEMDLNVTEYKTFVKDDLILDGADIDIKGYYSNGKSKNLSVNNVELSYESVDTGRVYGIEAPIPSSGDYILRASRNGVVSKEYKFSAVQYRTYIEDVTVDESFLNDVNEVMISTDEAFQIPLTVSPSNYTERFDFQLFDPSFAEVKWVDRGIIEVKAKKEGKVDLCLSFSTIKESLRVLRIPLNFFRVYIDSITAHGPANVQVGELVTVNLDITPVNHTMGTFAFSEDENIARVEKLDNNTYKVFGVKRGNTEITFYGCSGPFTTESGLTASGYTTATYKVNVIPKQNNNVTKDTLDPSLDSDTEQQEAFFNYSNTIEIELDFTNQAITKLRDYGRSDHNNAFYTMNEVYHPCTAKITINGQTNTYLEVGARMRGNTSRNQDFVNNDGTFNEHEFCHFKINFGQAFLKGECDYYEHDWTNNNSARYSREERVFGGMKKIDLKWNKNYDYSFTKEAYALSVFKEEGIVSQRSNLVYLTVKTDTDFRVEVYQAYEAIDKKFLKRYYGKSGNDNDLYKCTYVNKRPADMLSYDGDEIGVEGPNYRPVYALKTNETSSKHTDLKNFFNAIHSYKGRSGEDFYNYFQHYMDIEYFVKLNALCWVFGLPDDLRNNFNNYYIYFTNSGLAKIIPYDLDRCFGIFEDWAIHCETQTWDDKTALGTPDKTQGQSPLIFRFITGGSDHSWPVHEASKQLYYQYCVEYARKYLDVAKFKEFTNRVHASNKQIYIGGGAINENGHFVKYKQTINMTFPEYARIKKATLGL